MMSFDVLVILCLFSGGFVTLCRSLCRVCTHAYDVRSYCSNKPCINLDLTREAGTDLEKLPGNPNATALRTLTSTEMEPLVEKLEEQAALN